MAEQNRIDELFLEFTDENWERMDPEQRLATLQKMENLIAAEQGRAALQVVCFDPDEEKENVRGYYDGEALHINARCLKPQERLIPGISGNRGMQALNTILHEGRHAWQDEAACGKIEGVDPKERALIRMNNYFYCKSKDNQALYSCQPIELDARRFARERFEQMARKAFEAGHDDICIQRQLDNNDTEELDWACSVRERLSIYDLMDREEKALAKMRECEPATDLTGISMFREVFEMMKSNDGFMRYVDGKPLFVRELKVGDIAATFDAGPDAADDGLDPALRGLLDRLHTSKGATDALREDPDGMRLGMR